MLHSQQKDGKDGSLALDFPPNKRHNNKNKENKPSYHSWKFPGISFLNSLTHIWNTFLLITDWKHLPQFVTCAERWGENPFCCSHPGGLSSTLISTIRSKRLSGQTFSTSVSRVRLYNFKVHTCLVINNTLILVILTSIVCSVFIVSWVQELVSRYRGENCCFCHFSSRWHPPTQSKLHCDLWLP